MFAPTSQRLLLAALSALAPASIEDDPILLRWNLKSGEFLRYRVTMVQEMATSLPPEAGVEQEMAVEQEVAMVLRQEVREVAADGTASIDFGYEAVRIRVGGEEPRSYDSTRTGEDAKENDDSLSEMLAPLLEVKLAMKLEPTGRIAEIEGIEAVLKQMLSAGESPAMEKMLKEMLREDNLRRMMEVNVFPEEALAEGDSWQRVVAQDLPMLGRLEFAIVNELAGLEQRAGEPCARIAMEAKIALEAGEPTADSPMKLSMAESTGTGTMLFGVAAGRLFENDFSVRMEIDAAFPALEDAADLPKTMRMSLGMALRTRLLEEGEPAFE